MHFHHISDYSSQELQLRGTMVMTWYDFRLSWNPDEYDDLDYIELPLTEIWRPELIVYERLSKHSDVSFQTETDIVKVRNTGKVKWVTIASTRTFCSINVENFPRDKHTCDVTFTTWLHQDNEQKLQILGKMDSCEIEHLTWRLTFTGLGGNDSLYRCHQYLQNQSYVRYIATLERLDTNFGMYTFVIPNIFISLLSGFTICFPRGDSNGPAFGVMCLLALIIQLGTLYQVLPDTAFSKVGQSIAILTIAVAVVTFFSVINMVTEDDSCVVSKMTNLNQFYLKKRESWHNRHKKKQYIEMTNSSHDNVSETKNTNLDIESSEDNPSCSNTPEHIQITNRKVSPKANSSDDAVSESKNTNLDIEISEDNPSCSNTPEYIKITNRKVSPKANSSDDTVSETKHTNLDKESSEVIPSGSNIPEPVKVKDGSTRTQNVIQMLTWFNIKRAVAIVFFLAIGGINVYMRLSLNN
ncbi:neuronal acetylcholine receptor subunit non-alpha-2-like isoform X2 [Apostichopus japonicus]|uniref:neuronal acetylcholine receptor subunit non-alpha-2-like isoform X2 n=1 Tax=Stichopus japonicus TaxID=307972 RepID=UPI003AB19C10